MDREQATYQCESCGGELELAPDRLSGKCRYCRSVFYFREEKSEALVMALNRAGEMRRKCDFDGALTEYSVILNRTPKDAEAHWGMVLSTYGIEYVEDPRTQTMTPTCRRTVMKSILENEHYLEALSCASAEQKPIYEKKASVIDRLQKKIKRQLEDEEDYDVFISFKSTDDNGYPTKDREIARNIYEALRAKNIRAFYSEVTLADRMGDDYEPIIYKALYSSKCFILVATQEAYVNAVWVKNEWSRFRDRITDEGLRSAAFAVFEGISPMALPPFLRTQGIDLAKYPAGGYAEQIADNLAKKWGLAPKEESAEAKRLRAEMEEQLNRQKELEQRLNSMATPAQQSAGGVSVANLISRAKLFLEEKNWAEAGKQAERVLDMDSRCAEAYLVKLLCELELTDKQQLQQQDKAFDDSVYYKRAVQFADEELRTYLTACAENARKEEIYLDGVHSFEAAEDEAAYQKAAEIFAKIPGYKDADQKREVAFAHVQNIQNIKLTKIGARLHNARLSAECEGIVQELDAMGAYPGVEATVERAKEKYETLKHTEEAYFTEKLIRKILKLEKSLQRWRIVGVKTKDFGKYNGGAIVIPPYVKEKRITEIGYEAFRGCKSLISVAIPNSVTSIKRGAFRGCTGLTSVTIGNSVTSIEDDAFRDCTGLTSITIPDSVTRIGFVAFGDCSLTEVSYLGIKKKWIAISKGFGWSGSIKTIHCTDGTITL